MTVPDYLERGAVMRHLRGAPVSQIGGRGGTHKVAQKKSRGRRHCEGFHGVADVSRGGGGGFLPVTKTNRWRSGKDIIVRTCMLLKVGVQLNVPRTRATVEVLYLVLANFVSE